MFSVKNGNIVWAHRDLLLEALWGSLGSFFDLCVALFADVVL
jgi:hypothetical protein